MLVRQMTIYLFLMFLSASLPLEVCAWDGLTESCEHFDFFFWPQDTPSARGLLTIAEREYQRVTDIIGHRPDGKIQVYLARDPAEFRLLTRGHIPEWGIGAAIPSRSRIVLLSPRESPGNISLRQILAHEFSHVVLGQVLGQNRAPRWLDEGLAMFISHEWKLEQSILVARVLLFDSLIPLDEIDTVNAFGQAKASLAYAESFLAVAFIVDHFGEASLHQLIEELAQHGDIDLAMGISLGMTYREFQLLWQDEVTRRFNWASIVSHPIVLWTFILVLFLLVFVLKKLHNRKTMERWRQVEDGFDEAPWTTSTDEGWPGW